MSISNRIMRPRNDLSLTEPKAWNRSLWNLIGSRALSGESVDEYSALTYSAVYNAVSLIAGTVGSLPLHLYREEGKKKVLAQNKPLSYVMMSRPNPYMTSMALRETMMAHILTWGNSYSEKVRNGYGEIVELWPITPDRVRLDMEENELIYKIRLENEEITLTRDKVLHIPGLGFDGFIGYSVISMARKSIGLGMAMETYGSLFFGSGTHPGAIFSHPGRLSQPAHDNLKKSLGDAYSGLGQSHRMMLLEEGMKIEKLGISPEDSQFLESRQFQIPEIARWFNLPPHKLKDLTRSSFSNIEQEQISFVQDSILPWLIRIEQNYNAQLLTETEARVQKLYFKHNVEGLLRGDATSRGNFYRAMFNVAGMSINEIREKEDLDADPNPLADEKFVPLNMVPLSMVREMLEKNTSKKEPDPGSQDITPGNGDSRSQGGANNEMVQYRK